MCTSTDYCETRSPSYASKGRWAAAITIPYAHLELLVGALRLVLRLGTHSITHISGWHTHTD